MLSIRNLTSAIAHLALIDMVNQLLNEQDCMLWHKRTGAKCALEFAAKHSRLRRVQCRKL